METKEVKETKQVKEVKKTSVSKTKTTPKSAKTPVKKPSKTIKKPKLTPMKEERLSQKKENDKNISKFFRIAFDGEQVKQKICNICGRALVSDNYQKTFSWMALGREDEEGKRCSIICRDCSSDLFNYYYATNGKNLKLAMMRWCQTTDTYWDSDDLETARVIHINKTTKDVRTKSNVLAEYLGVIMRSKIEGRTYWDSPDVIEFINGLDIKKINSNDLKRLKSTELVNEDLGIRSKGKVNVNNLAPNGDFLPLTWTAEDKENYYKVLNLFKHDPFSREKDEDRCMLYRNLLGISDDSIVNDFTKTQAAIDMIRAIKRLDNLNTMRIKLEEDEKPSINEFKELAKLQESERKAIAQYSKDHGFAQKYNLSKSKGVGTLSGILKEMDASLFEDGIANRYDVITSESIQQAADASWKAIFNQLSFDETEYSKIIKDQNETIRNNQKLIDDLTENLRLANIEIERNKLIQQQLERKQLLDGVEYGS